jgi:hypothetical protein
VADFLLVLGAWSALSIVVGIAIGTVIYCLRRDPPEAVPVAPDGFLVGPDGLPVCGTAPPGLPEPCFRCGAMAECGTRVTVGHPATQRIANAVLCQDCHRMFWLDQAAFRDLFLKRVVEEFGDNE